MQLSELDDRVVNNLRQLWFKDNIVLEDTAAWERIRNMLKSNVSKPIYVSVSPESNTVFTIPIEKLVQTPKATSESVSLNTSTTAYFPAVTVPDGKLWTVTNIHLVEVFATSRLGWKDHNGNLAWLSKAISGPSEHTWAGTLKAQEGATFGARGSGSGGDINLKYSVSYLEEDL